MSNLDIRENNNSDNNNSNNNHPESLSITTMSQQEAGQETQTFDTNLQKELDKMEEELRRSKSKDTSGSYGKTDLDYLDPNLNYFEKFNDEELNQHLQKYISGDNSSHMGVAQTSAVDPALANITANTKKESNDIHTNLPKLGQKSRSDSKTALPAKPSMNEATSIVDDDPDLEGINVEKKESIEKKESQQPVSHIDSTNNDSSEDDNEDDIDKELEMYERVQEEMQKENQLKKEKKLQEVKSNSTSGNQSTLKEPSGKVVSKVEANTEGNANKSSENTQPGIFSASSTTATYKGLSIPANSELIKNRESRVLKAYKELLQDSKRIDQPMDVANAQLAALPLAITAPEHLSFNVQMLINTIPVLDNLSTQILRIIAREPFQSVMELVSNKESYSGIAFGNLVELFETTKRVYNSEENPFFTVENVTFGLWKYGEPAPEFLKEREETIEGTLRKVNLATFLLATLGLIDLGFFFLNEAFLDVFCPPQNLDPAKSVSYLSGDDVLQYTLPSSVARSMRSSHNQTKFLKSQAILYLELKTQAFISAVELGDRSKEEIIQDLFPDNMEEILMKRKDSTFVKEKKDIQRNSTFFTPAELDFLTRCDSRKKNLLSIKNDATLTQQYEWMKFLNDLLDYVSKNVGFLIWGPKGKISGQLSRRSANLKMDRTTSTSSKRFLSSGKRNIGYADEDNSSQRGLKRKKIRQRQNRPTTFRRTWTREEEEALRQGLKLKGTHWTAILELYGPGGSISEALKNRTSLQLKDKARNWKLYCLKNNIRIPDYLTKATGGGTVKKTNSGSTSAIEDQDDDNNGLGGFPTDSLNAMERSLEDVTKSGSMTPTLGNEDKLPDEAM